MLRKAIAIVLTVAIGMFALGNALSNALSRKSPEAAAPLSVYSADAHLQLAMQEIGSGAADGTLDVTRAQDQAMQAFARDGLATEAAAILALAQEDADQRAATLDVIDDLSLRGRLLNFGLMQSAAEAGDDEAALAALDRLMVLYTNVRSQLIPAMAEYLQDESTIPAFEQILRADPEWAGSLFSYRGGGPASVGALGRLRVRLGDQVTIEPAADRQLLRSLVNADQWDEATALYALLGGSGNATGGNPDQLDWANAFPPFEWQLADERDFHARPSLDGSDVAVRIDSGRGGDFATRLVSWPEGATHLWIEHTMEPIAQLSDMSVRLTCAETNQVLVEAEFMPSVTAAQLPQTDCQWIEIALAGRAWTGRTGLSGEITEIRFGS
ncbi:hypothetical protein [Aurantiacibacter gilvus]|uniref:Uncharacterized protein n=1 Tax=Aurantiacibacter gilvus TaxID=3139141 RepID=A0ABU9IH60_9SPHN